MEVIQNTVMATDETRSLKRKLEKELSEEEKSLKKLEQDRVRQIKFRENKRAKTELACEKAPQIADLLSVRKSAGRPRL